MIFIRHSKWPRTRNALRKVWLAVVFVGAAIAWCAITVVLWAMGD